MVDDFFLLPERSSRSSDEGNFEMKLESLCQYGFKMRLHSRFSNDEIAQIKLGAREKMLQREKFLTRDCWSFSNRFLRGPPRNARQACNPSEC